MISVKSTFLAIQTLSTFCLCTGHFDVATYRQMPPIYGADDYDQCLQHDSTASYCLVYAEIQPQPHFRLWQYIDEFYKNSSWTNYRHDLLYRGVCTSRCQGYSKSLANWNVTETQPTSHIVEMSRKMYKLSRSQKSIVAYEQQLHQCVNSELRERYNLSARTFVKYCEDPSEPIETGARYSMAAFVFSIIVVINLLSTLYDVLLKLQLNEMKRTTYYDTQHQDTVNYYLTSFSLFRNFRRLLRPDNSAIGRDLKIIDGFRSILSSIIIFEHVILMVFFPVINSEFLEQQHSSTFGLWIMHLSPCVELFFVMSGLLLYIKFAKGDYLSPASSWAECGKVYGRMMISRYLRFMPSILFLIFFTSHVFFHLGSGPFWRLSIEPSVLACRNYWWTNVLMTTNQDCLNTVNTCWPHTWYIAADFQLYAIFLAVLVIMAKYPKLKNIVYPTVGVIGLVTPSLIIYIRKLNPTAVLTPENSRHWFLNFKDNESMPHVYFSSYTNLNGFFIGIVCGELYMNYLKYDKLKKIVRYYLKPTPLIGWPIIFGIWYLGTTIIFKESTIWTSMFVILHRHLSIAIVASVVILRGICSKNSFLSWPIFRPLARVSYQVYLWHFILIYGRLFSERHLLEMSILRMIFMNALIYPMSVLVATIVATMLEYPIAELLKVCDLKCKPKVVKISMD